MSYKERFEKIELEVKELQRVIDVLIRGRADVKREETVVKDSIPALGSENWDG